MPKSLSIQKFTSVFSGYHSLIACSDTIYVDSMFFNLKKASHFEGIPKQPATLSFDHVDISW